MLCEGGSMRGTARVNEVAYNTVNKMLVDGGESCYEFHDNHVVGINASHIQMDELYGSIYAKDKNLHEVRVRAPYMGGVAVWLAIDADSKLIIAWEYGGKGADRAVDLLRDVRGRITGPVDISTDGLSSYTEAINLVMGRDDLKGYVQSVSVPSAPGMHDHKRIIRGDDSLQIEDFNTSIVERMNLTMRMGMKRMTRRTNALSKSAPHFVYAVSIYLVYYNWIRPHRTLTERRRGLETTPAMAAGLAERPFTWEGLLDYIDSSQPPPKKRGPYKNHTRPKARENNARRRADEKRKHALMGSPRDPGAPIPRSRVVRTIGRPGA